MNVHKNAPLTPQGRLRMVRRALEGASHAQVAREFKTTIRTVSKWVRRYLEAGEVGLLDHSSRPHHAHPRALSTKSVRRIGLLRRRRWTIERIAQTVNASPATVARYLKRIGLNRLSSLEPTQAVVRYERAEPGSLVHMDTKKLGRFVRPGHRVTGDRQRHSINVGWEFAHVLIDDASRICYVEVLADERKTTVIGFVDRALRYFKDLGVEIKQLMTDNGPAYRSKLVARFLEAVQIRHLLTRPYSPQTNGKAERFIQTLLREWAYGRRYRTSYQRSQALWPWLHDYNWHRPHGSLGRRPPITRLGLHLTNLLRHHS
jgi:transposase InsO family protein